MKNVKCSVCNKEELVSPSRYKSYQTCSIKCLSSLKKSKTLNNCKCNYCKKDFHLKESQIKRYNRRMGIFCSSKCCSLYKKEYYLGKNNPNFRGRQLDSDGYIINHYPKIGRMKEHHFVAFNILNIKKLPKGYCIHHRDCNIYNNDPINLALLSGSDHRWLHKQFGNATLWAFMNKKVSLEELINWSNDPKRSLLLECNILTQSGVIKSDELRGNLEVDNPDPSQLGIIERSND